LSKGTVLHIVLVGTIQVNQCYRVGLRPLGSENELAGTRQRRSSNEPRQKIARADFVIAHICDAPWSLAIHHQYKTPGLVDQFAFTTRGVADDGCCIARKDRVSRFKQGETIVGNLEKFAGGIPFAISYQFIPFFLILC